MEIPPMEKSPRNSDTPLGDIVEQLDPLGDIVSRPTVVVSFFLYVVCPHDRLPAAPLHF